ncbi:MAG: phospholipase [Deltaproteobacteria bacterium]
MIQKVLAAAGIIFIAGSIVFLSEAAMRETSEGSTGDSCDVTPLMNEAFFPALLQAVDGAKNEIFITMYSFKTGVHPASYPDRLLEHLARAVKRGVHVKVILEGAGERQNDLSRQNFKTKELLEKRGVKVYLDSPKRTTHVKLIVVDQRLVFVGSHNLTPSALKHNNEVSILIEKPDLAQNIRNYMLTIIEEAK